MRPAIIAVSVATVWTSPDSPNEKDLPALAILADLRGWLGSLTIEDKLDFYNRNAIQTQALFGTRVEVLEEQGEWSHILIPEQSCKKNSGGYPGWVPTVQLAPWSDVYSLVGGQPEVMVTSAHTRLYDLKGAEGIELAYLTRLPLLEETSEGVIVSTVFGPSLLRKKDVQIVLPGEPAEPIELGEPTEPTPTSAREHTSKGEAIVANAKRFLGLPYLWGGMSSYGYDCSGFAYNMHRSLGIVIPRDASDQAVAGVQVEKKDLLPGDLLFFAYEEGKGRVHHVGIYMGNGEMIHSPDSRGAIEIVQLSGYKLEHEHSVSRRFWQD